MCDRLEKLPAEPARSDVSEFVKLLRGVIREETADVSKQLEEVRHVQKRLGSAVDNLFAQVGALPKSNQRIDGIQGELDRLTREAMAFKVLVCSDLEQLRGTVEALADRAENAFSRLDRNLDGDIQELRGRIKALENERSSRCA